MIANLRRLSPADFRGLARRVAREPHRMAEGWRCARKVASENGLSALRLFGEQILLEKFFSINRYSYYLYRLFEPGLSWEEKKTYLADDYYSEERGEANLRLWALLAPEKYRGLYDNKLAFNRFFGSLGLPLAEVYGVYDPVYGRTLDGRRLRDAHDLRRWLATSGVEEFVFKPVEGAEGHKILVFCGRESGDPDRLVTLDGDVYDAERLVASTKEDAALRAGNPGADTRSYLIERRIRQHPELTALVGQTLCCIRVQTIVTLEGEPRIIASVCKLQPNPVGVDHLIHNAVGAWVDPDSGALGRGRTRGDLDYVSVLPGTETPFVGFRLPYWSEVKGLALRAAAAFPWVRSVGWDIAISERGPVLVEGNERWAVSLVQMAAPHGLMTGEFKALCEALREGGGA
jgi:Sugar-transfer associated ATP-grasp